MVWNVWEGKTTAKHEALPRYKMDGSVALLLCSLA